MSGAGAGRVGKWGYVLMGEHLCADINQGAMSAVGGNVGFALGPALVAVFVGAFGMAGADAVLRPRAYVRLRRAARQAWRRGRAR